MEDRYEKKSDIPEAELANYYRERSTGDYVRIKPHPEPAPVAETTAENQNDIAKDAASGATFGGAEGKAAEAAKSAQTSTPAVSVIK